MSARQQTVVLHLMVAQCLCCLRLCSDICDHHHANLPTTSSCRANRSAVHKRSKWYYKNWWSLKYVLHNSDKEAWPRVATLRFFSLPLRDSPTRLGHDSAHTAMLRLRHPVGPTDPGACSILPLRVPLQSMVHQMIPKRSRSSLRPAVHGAIPIHAELRSQSNHLRMLGLGAVSHSLLAIASPNGPSTAEFVALAAFCHNFLGVKQHGLCDASQPQQQLLECLEATSEQMPVALLPRVPKEAEAPMGQEHLVGPCRCAQSQETCEGVVAAFPCLRHQVHLEVYLLKHSHLSAVLLALPNRSPENYQG
mmetsp:Transcript_72434/g.114393  ORF Transcript_72434/g.114393 Transcript_72434/m.114393 type:complete len:307 (-) Transcript_72434:353-1273(-)